MLRMVILQFNQLDMLLLYTQLIIIYNKQRSLHPSRITVQLYLLIGYIPNNGQLLGNHSLPPQLNQRLYQEICIPMYPNPRSI
mmetsp:Transcript_37142/g.6626  ORF Transcript_37142/g.6626 Transcript_37142/m.6626 type:complete len:83 (+) Transcript_37142:2022-2270(+)